MPFVRLIIKPRLVSILGYVNVNHLKSVKRSALSVKPSRLSVFFRGTCKLKSGFLR
jgi:hypothetical protein